MILKTWLRWDSLKARVTLLSLGVFLLGIWSLSFYAIRLLRDDLQTLLGDQQFATVSALAAELDRALEDRLKAMSIVAASVDRAAMGNARTLQTLLENRPLLGDLFNAGVIIHGGDGTALAEFPRGAGRVGVNYMDIEAVATALGQGRAAVGQPVIGKKLGVPVFGMTVPIRDGHGRVIGAVSGVTDLSKPGFLDRVAQDHYGRTGGYMLVARQPRLVVAATDTRLDMTRLPAPGSNLLIDRFVGGYEGSGVTVNPLGIEVLASAKSIPLADWYVAVALPTREAFGPIDTMQRRMLLAALVLTLLVGLLTWWMLRRQMSPLLETVKALVLLPDACQRPHPLPVAGLEEIAELIRGVNRLLETLAQREAMLRESEERYRSFFQASPDAIFVHRDDIIVFANDATARLLHADSVRDLIGLDWHELILPEYWPVTEQRIASLVSGEATQMPPLERRHMALDGQVVTVESAGARIIFDGKPAVLSVIRDITARKQTEAQRLADTRQQRDTLVREVHHRIKNNLQSVAGLLQRELGRFVELDPRLATAISQVHAIAMVHGLQGANADETVRLCDSVRSICRTVAELSQCPVEFTIENEQTAFRPVFIQNDEAVSVALVLNELILNAVKHSPADGGAPTVSLSADGNSARIVICNAVSSGQRPEIDFDSGRGLGTGLRLVRSLLPDRGASLRHEADAAGGMCATLQLGYPVIGNIDSRGTQASS